MWDNLKSYCDPCGTGVVAVVPTNVPLPSIHTLSHPASLCFPGARQQAIALDALYGWYTAHLRRTPAAMTSEPSIQDEVHAQLLEPLNILLQV